MKSIFLNFLFFEFYFFIDNYYQFLFIAKKYLSIFLKFFFKTKIIFNLKEKSKTKKKRLFFNEKRAFFLI
jgi:hypothetical protein